MTIRDWTKGWLTVVLFGIMAVGFTFGCGGDPPKANLDAATQALQAAKDAGAEKYATGELSSAQSAFGKAKNAYDAEAENMFKDWDKVKPLLDDAKNKANVAETTANQAKAKAKSVADAAINSAVGAIEGAQTSMEYAPAGKGTESDIEQLRADLGGAESDLSAARSAVSREDFEAATSKATSAKSAAVEIAGAVQQAVVRYNDLVEKNKPWYLKN